MDRGAWRATVHGIAELDMTERLSTVCAHLENCLFRSSTQFLIGLVFFFLDIELYKFFLMETFVILIVVVMVL